MISVKFNSRRSEHTENGNVTTVSWIGTKEEITEFSREEIPGQASNSDGTLDSVSVYQEGPNIWVCERRYTTDPDGNSFEKPNQVYGKKSAQLSCSMLSLPIEGKKGYRKKWNYYLMAAPGVSAVPGWWETATYDSSELVGADAQKYAWCKSLSEAPVDSKGRWQKLKSPQKPGVDSYDLATYSITETAKFKSARAAGRMIGNIINQIGKPTEDFGMTPSGYNWKCDGASVSYNGKAWYATITWTRSGDNKGWDTDLYQ